MNNILYIFSDVVEKRRVKRLHPVARAVSAGDLLGMLTFLRSRRQV